MDVKQLVTETLQEIDKDLEAALEGLTTEEMDWRPGDEANSIGFTLWHLIRAEDHWLSGFAMKLSDLFERDGWDKCWGMAGASTGWGYGKEELAAFVTPPIKELWQYGRDVRTRTLEYMASIDAAQFLETPFSSNPWHEGYTIGRMFGHILCELSQHLGHVRYLRGLQRGINM